MRAHDGRIEHLNEMRRGAHRRERIEKRLEDAGLAQPVEPLPHAVPMAEALRQSAPSNVLDGEKMQRLEEAAIVLGFPTTTRLAGAKHRQRVRPILLIHLRRHWPRPLIRAESYESCLIPKRNRKTSSDQNSSTQTRLRRYFDWRHLTVTSGPTDARLGVTNG